MSRDGSSANGLRHFENTRAVITKIQDNQELFAWVHPSPAGTLILVTALTDSVLNGDPCIIHLNSNQASTTFSAICSGNLDGKAYFPVPSLIRMEPPKAQIRRRAPLINARILTGTEEVQCPVIDVAERGLGLETPASYETGQHLKIILETKTGEVHVEGTVVYCRLDDETQLFRTGFNITRLSRIDERRWSQLLAA